VFQNQQNGVSEFNKFSQVVQVVQTDHWLSPSTNVTDSIVQTVLVQHWDQLFDEQNQQSTRQGSQEQVVELGNFFQNKRLGVLQNKSTPENDNIVGQNGTGNNREVGQWCFVFDEVEFAWNEFSLSQNSDNFIELGKQIDVEKDMIDGWGKLFHTIRKRRHELV